MNTMVMKNLKRTFIVALSLMFIALACERSVDGLEEPGFSENPDVFIDGFSAGLEYFPFADSDQDAFSVDSDDTHNNTAASMRFDVPNVGDPEGGYAGAIFRDENGGRNLTSYNALTFYAKGTVPGTINEIGFGQDFGDDEYVVSLNNLKLTTNWEQYVVPIPDASNLTSEQGLLWYAEGPEDGDGYSFWLDEVKYENLEGLAQPRPAIQNGNDVTQTSFIGSTALISGLTYTANRVTEDGIAVDVTVGASPAYYEFSSSNTNVATVDSEGLVSVIGEGTAEITGSIGGITAQGSLIIESDGEFVAAPTPTEPASEVISIFSDTYDNVPVDFYNGFYAPFQETTSNDFTVNGNNVLGYDNFNFVGIEFNQNVPTIDASDMTNLKMSVFFPNEVPEGSALRVVLVDVGSDGSVGGGDDSSVSSVLRPTTNPALESGQWVTFDFDITGLTNQNNLGQIVLDADLGIALRGSSFYVDNIYLYDNTAE
jgi:hypothetical protein